MYTFAVLWMLAIAEVSFGACSEDDSVAKKNKKIELLLKGIHTFRAYSAVWRASTVETCSVVFS